ncbi:hypothetical protein MHBO_004736 [Bonamia ostreae]|uniref:3-beta hydroxysteroid dehydrogenase/isomerase domain-containing protein n=1 Tax=Bonamia ostreae TaxID=126728 RepID=A0ABV2AU58_9EUKA
MIALGSGKNLANFTFVDNVSYALVLAATELSYNSPLNNQAYFITNKKVVNFWEFVGKIYSGLGYSKPSIFVNETLILRISKFLAVLSARLKNYKPFLTEEKVLYTTKHHFYCDDKATRDFGYFPPVSMEEGIEKTLEAFQYLAKEETEPTILQRYNIKGRVIQLIVCYFVMRSLWKLIWKY